MGGPEVLPRKILKNLLLAGAFWCYFKGIINFQKNTKTMLTTTINKVIRTVYKIERVYHFLIHMHLWEADIPWLVRRKPNMRTHVWLYLGVRHSLAVAGSDSSYSY